MSAPLPLADLSSGLSGVALRSGELLESLLASPAKSALVNLFQVPQVGASQATPVKLLIWKPLRCHFRHGLPLRSSARSFSLMAP